MIRLAVLREATAAPNNLLIHDAPKHLLKDDHDMLLTLEWDVPVKKFLKTRGVGLAEPSAMRTTPSRRSTGSDAEKQQSSNKDPVWSCSCCRHMRTFGCGQFQISVDGTKSGGTMVKGAPATV